MISKSGNVRFWSFMVVTVNKWSKKVRKCKIRAGTITTFASVDCFVPVDFRIHRVNNCGSATRADNKSASYLTRGLQIPENVETRTGTLIRPCGFPNPQGVNCGSATRADSISAISVSGIANPREQSVFP